MRRAKIEIAFPFTPICGSRQICSHKVEFSFMNGNLIAPAGQPLIIINDTATNEGGTRVWLFDSGQRRGTI
jgi:hypothetical protein